MRGGLLLPIGDKAKIRRSACAVNEKSGVAPETKGGVSVVDLGKEGDAGVLCAYNDIAFMVYFVQNGVDDLAGDVRKLFAQQSGESLMGDQGPLRSSSPGRTTSTWCFRTVRYSP